MRKYAKYKAKTQKLIVVYIVQAMYMHFPHFFHNLNEDTKITLY
jgi:hypothetical protein